MTPHHFITFYSIVDIFIYLFNYLCSNHVPNLVDLDIQGLCLDDF